RRGRSRVGGARQPATGGRRRARRDAPQAARPTTRAAPARGRRALPDLGRRAAVGRPGGHPARRRRRPVARRGGRLRRNPRGAPEGAARLSARRRAGSRRPRPGDGLGVGRDLARGPHGRDVPAAARGL
ncbi:MAG: hypothetical protein AVDCRST_MAG79-3050, partial [uncultured Thermoleophilia bacterium]